MISDTVQLIRLHPPGGAEGTGLSSSCLGRSKRGTSEGRVRGVPSYGCGDSICTLLLIKCPLLGLRLFLPGGGRLNFFSRVGVKFNSGISMSILSIERLRLSVSKRDDS